MKNNLFKTLADAATEEELKNFFAKFFRIKLSTKNFIDLYTPQILFEFKLDAPLNNLPTRAKIIAQTLYYIRRLKFGSDIRKPSDNICVVTKNSAVFLPTETFADFYSDKTRYDWDLAPSSPCKILVSDLADFAPVKNALVYDLSVYSIEIAFSKLIMDNRKRQFSLSDQKKQINEQNFYQIFQYWQKLFGKAVENGKKDSEYFITDIEDGKSELLSRSVIFRMSGGDIKEKTIKPDDYKLFWSRYEKITSASEIIAIRQKMDRITEINLRRFTGEFYTPVNFARKAFDYLTRTVGEWWKDKNFRLWDMAAGTGNLEFALPYDALKFCYISTLLDDDANYCKKIFPEATAFQYDYLNDDLNKLPKKLRDDLNNPDIHWIIFINPPYATANNKQLNNQEIDKSGVSMTEIRKQMIAEEIGKSSQELFMQFIYRISKDFSNKIAYLGIFSTLKYIIANSEQKIRDKFFKYKFECGFIFNSKNFEGCIGQFPVGFIVWNLSERISLEEQEISLDIYDSEVEKIAKKIFYIANPVESLNKWIKRPRNVKKFPPMSSALKIAYNNKDKNDKIAENFLAGFMIKGNDFLNQNSTALLSAPYASHAGFSITPENFEQAMIVHMVRRLPKATWLNDRDQFLQPNKPLSREFITDAVIWSLFAPSNQTASLKNVEYEGEIYQIRNNFYPFELAEIKSWECTSPAIRMRIARATEDRFAAKWLKNNRADLSSAAKAVLNAGRDIYQMFYAVLASMVNLKAYKIEDWDVGWYQIRMIMKHFENLLALRIPFQELSAKLEPQIYELGFLRDEVRYF